MSTLWLLIVTDLDHLRLLYHTSLDDIRRFIKQVVAPAFCDQNHMTAVDNLVNLVSLCAKITIFIDESINRTFFLRTSDIIKLNK